MNWRTASEARLEKMGIGITNHPKKIIALLLIVAFALISNLPKITIDTSTEGFLHKNDPALVSYEAFKEQFGQDEKILVVVENSDIFAVKNINKLRKLHEKLKSEIPHLNDITSLINARNTRGEKDTLIVEDLFENFPKSQDELSKIKETALHNPLYKNMLFNDDLTMTSIILEPSAYESSSDINALEGFAEESNEKSEFLSDPSKSEMVRAANAIAQEFDTKEFHVYVAGSLAVNDYNKQSLQKDMQKFIRLVLLVIIIFLFLLFHRVSAVILPLFIVAISLLMTLSLMALTATPISIPTQILPSFLLAVGIGAVVHLLAMFFKHFNEHKQKNEAIAFSLGHSGLAIIMTSLTTAAGLLSFSTASVSPIADLGIFAAVGVMIALVNTLILLPALLAVIPLKPAKEKQVQKSEKMDALLLSMANFSVTHAKKIVSITFVAALIWLYFATKVSFEHDPLSWQPENSPIKIATKRVDAAMKGSVTMEVLIDTKKTNGLYNPQLLTKIDTLVKDAQELDTELGFIGKGWSVADVLKEIHKALNENRAEFYAITENEQLIPQEFLLFENSGSDDLEDFVDSGFSKARVTFKLPWMEAGAYTELNNKLQQMFQERLSGVAEVTITGMVPLFQRTLFAAIETMGLSYLIAFALIAMMMIILLGSIKIGLISMIPNTLPVILTLGFMGMTGMPLDLFTMLIGAIVIGLSVDDTVHFFHNFARYHHQGYSAQESVQKSMLTTGRALVATTVVLSLGFYVYAFASLSNLINFGILTGGAITLALFANIILGPALLVLTTKEKK
ncbi:MAG: RND family transporter [Campylobacterales bacterium]|nr:RND family transporter [Campylobacterales bacterium]